MVERDTVNIDVGGSIPSAGAREVEELGLSRLPWKQQHDSSNLSFPTK